MNGQNNTTARGHDVSIKGRAHIDITGVREVVSFDDCAVSVITDGGDMTLEGEELKIGALDTDRGLLSVDGKLNGLFYNDIRATGGKGIFGRLFKS